MKTIWSLLSLVLVLSVGDALAATLTVDRNSESDMDHYNVYACFIPGCTVLQNSAMRQPLTMPQSAVGLRPTATIDLTAREGRVAVSAADVSGNESGLSVPLPFDQRAPTVSLNPTLTP